MRKEGLISCLERGIKWFFVVSLVGFVLLLFSCGDSKESVYSSNGEQIYFSGTSERGTEISVEGMTGNDHMVCAGCHGPDGKGRSIRMMEEEIKSTDIRYKFLTAKEHIHG